MNAGTDDVFTIKNTEPLDLQPGVFHIHTSINYRRHCPKSANFLSDTSFWWSDSFKKSLQAQQGFQRFFLKVYCPELEAFHNTSSAGINQLMMLVNGAIKGD